MARRARKTPLEKCQEELLTVKASIERYDHCLETLREKEKQLENQILMEKFREINELLESFRNLSSDDLKDMLGEKKGGNAGSLLILKKILIEKIKLRYC